VVDPRRKVLIVDDSLLARTLLARRVESEGFEVALSPSVAASSAFDAAELWCALLDLDLGDGDGTEVAAALRARRPELPIAFFSASVAREVVARAHLLGPVFTKPDDLDLAVAWVRANAK
jgi:DNA-binding response OmpR family regulator